MIILPTVAEIFSLSEFTELFNTVYGGILPNISSLCSFVQDNCIRFPDPIRLRLQYPDSRLTAIHFLFIGIWNQKSDTPFLRKKGLGQLYTQDEITLIELNLVHGSTRETRFIKMSFLHSGFGWHRYENQWQCIGFHSDYRVPTGSDIIFFKVGQLD